ncbi:predicted protein [Uncinocarpus reesii 1704]|uniref:Origin recognition complex subunit 4 n=1 Tax=Uncinocarpus reesii (strain UAMH 1704) TaxID=336963 RepID=C4JEV2_UNCRE|nr:uncharacterized protein UREG_02262 [Uncinocarpus reesii 1704]EEP77413.1 predicted protein [Uncinocarpus reesii 1704]
MTESRTLRSSKRRKLSNTALVKDDDRSDFLHEAKESVEPNVQGKTRSSSRLKKAQSNGAPPKPSSSRARQTDPQKENTGKTTATKKRLKPVASVGRPKERNKDLEDESIWDIPIEVDTEQDGQGQDGLVGALLSRACGPQKDVEDADSSAVAAQLQLELSRNQLVIPLPQLLEDTPYAAKLRSFCESHGLEDMTRSLAKFLLEKLNGTQLLPLKGLAAEYQAVYQLIEQTILAGEGNSMLLLGARGCGKTALLETAISNLSKSHKEDFHVVRLNGFLHTDDKISLREIWHQLGREINVDDDLSKTSTYADTMASLLALLSEVPNDASDAFTTTKSVIIILDEFDLFTYHPRQTLLYNLFDIAQAKKAPIAVIGLTTKVDVMETLEKRVKSRFSHRYAFLPRPRTLAEFSEICMAGLKIDSVEIQDYSLQSRQSHHSDNIRSIVKSPKFQTLLEQWNAYLERLWDDKPFQTHLKTIFHRTKCPKDFFTSALLPVSNLALGPSHKPLLIPTANSFTSDILCPDPAPFPFPTASATSTSTVSLPVSLLLAATRLTALHDPNLSSQPQSLIPVTLSFPAVYAEYVRLLTSAKASASASGAAATPGRIWGKEAAREAWEKLIGWGLVVPAPGGGGIGDGKTYKIEISFEEVVDGMGQNGVGALGRWWRDG